LPHKTDIHRDLTLIRQHGRVDTLKCQMVLAWRICWSMYMALRRNLRVLVVDDMSISRQILLQMLEQIGVASVDT
jgi:hypothetical protein